MKTMTCKQLGGACNQEFHAETFEEMAQLSKAHGGEMFEKQEASHLKAMLKMGALMHDPQATQKWFTDKKAASRIMISRNQTLTQNEKDVENR